MKNNLIIGLMGIMGFATLLPSCSKEFLNPSAPSQPTVTTSVDGLMNMAAGLQRRFTIGRQSPLFAAPTGGGLAVFNLNVLNAGNTDEVNLEIGKANVAGNNGIVSNLWAQGLYGKNEAEIILDNLGIVGDAGDKLGLKAFASVFYALNMGTLAQYFEQIPLITAQNAGFSSREEVLKKVVTLLESVDADFNGGGTISAKFVGKVPAGIDLKNTVKALIARYSNMLAQLPGKAYDATYGAKATAAAAAVSQSVKSEFRFTTATPNPLAETFRSVNICGVVDSTLGLKAGMQPTPGDGRLAFYLTRSTLYNPNTNVLTARNFVTDLATAVPVYLPGEMVLIQAENIARTGTNLAAAKNLLDLIIKKAPAADAWGVGANIAAGYTGPVTQADVLKEIYRQRRIELFMSGQELEDSRRFGRPAPNATGEERNRNWYPYPNQERDNNTSTPDNPAI